MEFIILYFFEVFIPDVLWNPDPIKIEVRLFSAFPNKDNKLSIEIENTSYNFVTLQSVTLVLKDKTTRKLIHQSLNLSNDQLNLAAYSPEKVILTTESKNNDANLLIKHFEFKLAEKRTIKVKPSNLFSSH